MIPHSRPYIDDADVQAVRDVLMSGRLVQGEIVASLEDSYGHILASSCLAEVDSIDKPTEFFAAAVSSGTAALHLTLLALGIGKDDEVVIPSYVCTALWHAVSYTGAKPVLADCEEETGNVAVASVKSCLTDKTRAVIVPHLFGQAADIGELIRLGVPVIEDCAQSLGSRYHGALTGTFGTAAIYSFYATKVIAAGEGGMVVSRNAKLIDTIRDLRDYDEKDNLVQRFNYKLTDLQAALVRSQLKKLPFFIDGRRRLARSYDDILREENIAPPVRKPARDHIYYRYVFSLGDADSFIKEMEQQGVSCRRPIYRPLHQYTGSSGCEIAESLWRRSVSIPLYPDLTEEEVAMVISALANSLGKDK